MARRTLLGIGSAAEKPLAGYSGSFDLTLASSL
jgi:hypothetical protein